MGSPCVGLEIVVDLGGAPAAAGPGPPAQPPRTRSRGGPSVGRPSAPVPAADGLEPATGAGRRHARLLGPPLQVRGLSS